MLVYDVSLLTCCIYSNLWNVVQQGKQKHKRAPAQGQDSQYQGMCLLIQLVKVTMKEPWKCPGQSTGTQFTKFSRTFWHVPMSLSLPCSSQTKNISSKPMRNPLIGQMNQNKKTQNIVCQTFYCCSYFSRHSLFSILKHSSVVFAVESLYKACFHHTVRCWSTYIYIMLNHNALVKKKKKKIRLLWQRKTKAVCAAHTVNLVKDSGYTFTYNKCHAI